MIDKTDNVIDSLDVIERFAELSYASDEGYIEDDEKIELTELAKLILMAEDLPDWNYGAQLIHESYFTEYVKQYRLDVDHEAFDAIPEIYKSNLDWDGIAEDMLSDYTVIEWQGETFYTL